MKKHKRIFCIMLTALLLMISATVVAFGASFRWDKNYAGIYITDENNSDVEYVGAVRSWNTDSDGMVKSTVTWTDPDTGEEKSESIKYYDFDYLSIDVADVLTYEDFINAYDAETGTLDVPIKLSKPKYASGAETEYVWDNSKYEEFDFQVKVIDFTAGCDVDQIVSLSPNMSFISATTLPDDFVTRGQITDTYITVKAKGAIVDRITDVSVLNESSIAWGEKLNMQFKYSFNYRATSITVTAKNVNTGEIVSISRDINNQTYDDETHQGIYKWNRTLSNYDWPAGDYKIESVRMSYYTDKYISVEYRPENATFSVTTPFGDVVFDKKYYDQNLDAALSNLQDGDKAVIRCEANSETGNGRIVKKSYLDAIKGKNITLIFPDGKYVYVNGAEITGETRKVFIGVSGSSMGYADDEDWYEYGDCAESIDLQFDFVEDGTLPGAFYYNFGDIKKSSYFEDVLVIDYDKVIDNLIFDYVSLGKIHTEIGDSVFYDENGLTFKLTQTKDINTGTKKAIDDANITGIIDKSFTGKAVTQSPVITYNGEPLKEGTDYEVSYENNINVGWALIKIKGLGEFGGRHAELFKITEGSSGGGGGGASSGGDEPTVNPKEEAKPVTLAIDALSTDNPDPTAVAAAREAYNKLSDEAKKSVPPETLKKLETAEVKVVVSLVEALDEEYPDPDAVAEAKSAYEKLSDGAKSAFPAETLNKLEAAEAAVIANEQKAVGAETVISAGTVTVTSTENKTVAFTAASSSKKSIVIPATVEIAGETFKVTEVSAGAFKGTAATSVTIGKNVKKISSKAFAGSKATKLIVKSKKLTKKSVKNSLKGSKVKTVQIKVGTKKQNKTYVKKYKKFWPYNFIWGQAKMTLLQYLG